MTGKDSRNKHVPERMCVICRKRYSKYDLSRFVPVEGACGDELVPDDNFTMQGRGYYVCGDARCREKMKFFRPRRKKSRG